MDCNSVFTPEMNIRACTTLAFSACNRKCTYIYVYVYNQFNSSVKEEKSVENIKDSYIASTHLRNKYARNEHYTT